ncbi:hypothetical protein E0Z10_g179 [Xylaria hypoxylon]|uniref:Carrier domain-containing protein n=1 Tax=Xylaria hypoxylon TaxID=37992 RepID=A0A4Z0ZFY7_9PEZI|nr:hypothetical protein E0Z10_g179 [Xylaria hypoxylon]
MSLGGQEPLHVDGLSVLNAEPRRLLGPSFLHELVPQAANNGVSAAIDFLSENGRRIMLSYPELHAASLALASSISCILGSALTPSASASEAQDPLIIPILSPQSPQLYVAILAALKAGGAFCPLNTDAPPDRVRFILDDVKAKIVLVSRVLASKLPADDKTYKVIFIDDVLDNLETKGNDFASPRELKPEHLAYVMYTSGSTGTPKGVAVSHLAATQSILAHERHIPSFSKFLQFAAPTFDVSVFEIFFPFLRGATLVGCNRAEMLTDLVGVLKRMEVDACELTPTVAGSLLRQRSRAPSLRLLLTIGEMLTEPVIQEFAGDEHNMSILWGMYGPTEATIHCTVQPAFAATLDRGTIGVPFETVSAFVIRIPTNPSVDFQFDVLPVGEIGELALGGLQLATYYLNRPEETAASFVNTPWGRVYRTGDKAKIRPDGTIECLGRIDGSQVKLNGQRLELGEVEQVLLRTSGCHSAVVAVISNVLVAFAAVEQISDSNTQLWAQCRAWLPTFMIPTDIVIMERLPQLPSGKVDRKQLVYDYSARTMNAAGNEEAVDDHERLLCEVATAILGERVGPLTEFSAAKLDSLAAIKYASMLRERGILITPIDILNTKTPRKLRQRIGDVTTLTTVPESEHHSTHYQLFDHCPDKVKLKPTLGDQVQEIDRLEIPTPLQQSMIAETLKGDHLYINHIKFELISHVTLDALQSSLKTLAEYNEILRTGFAFVENQLCQVIWKRLDDVQLNGNTDGKSSVDGAEDVELFLLRPLKIGIRPPGPGGDRFSLLLTLHHAIYDGWTIDLIIEDLSLLLSGGLPTKRPQFSQVMRHLNYNPEVKSIDSMEFWTEHLRGVGAVTTSNFRTVAVTEPQRAIIMTKIPLHPRNLKNLMLEARVGPQVLFQACLVWLWAAVQGSENTTIGCVSSGRSLPLAGIDKLMGPCMTTLPLRVNISRYRTIVELLQSIHSINRKTLQHGHIPLSEINKVAGLSTNSKLFDVIFAYQESPASRKQNSNIVREAWHRDATEANGTTGTPKGVAVTNRNILSNISILSGIYPHDPSMASLLNPDNVPAVKFLVTSGEPMTDEVLNRWSQYLYQGYGPSETTNICTVRKVSSGDSSRFLGWSFENTSTFVLHPSSTDLVPDQGTGTNSTAYFPIFPSGLYGADIHISYIRTAFDFVRSTEDHVDMHSNWSGTETSIADVITDSLKKDRNEISRWTTFSTLGLDSISAMPVARELQSVFGKRIPLSLLLQNPNVSRLASAIDELEGPGESKYSNGPLLPEELIETMRKHFMAKGRSVAKVLPCTPLQEAMVMSSLNPSVTTADNRVAYYNQMLFHLRIAFEIMMRLWNEVVQRHEILRALFVTSDNIRHPAVQIILDSYVPKWQVLETECVSLHERASQHVASTSIATRFDEPPMGLAIIRTQESGDYLSFVCHHAMYDGISMRIMLSEIEALYHGRLLSEPPSIEPFLREMQLSYPNQDTFWRQLFLGFQPTALKCAEATEDKMPRSLNGNASKMSLELIESQLRDTGVSMLALIQTAWAITLAILSQRSDVSFGSVIAGRSISLDMVDNLVAPCFNTLPIRIDLSLSTFLIDVMKGLQSLNAKLMLYQFTSLRHIQKDINTQTRLFDTLVILQPPTTPLDDTLWSLVHEEGVMDIPLVCEFIPSKLEDTLTMQLHRDTSKFSYQSLQLIHNIFSHVLDACLRYPSSHVFTSEVLPEDWQKLALQLFHRPELPLVLNNLSNEASHHEETWSPLELTVRQTLAKLAEVPEDQIKRLAPIYQYGLDSITAIQLATLLRQQSVFVSAIDVLEHPTCAGIAAATGNFVEEDLYGGYDFNSFQRQVEAEVLEYEIDLETIEEILPCTATQQGLLSQFLESKGRYYFNYSSWVLDIAEGSKAIAWAWSQLTNHHQILRTGFVPVNHADSAFAMLVYRMNHFTAPVEVYGSDAFDVEQWLSDATTDSLKTLARPPWRLALVTPGSVDSEGSLTMHFAMHHALYDAFTLRSLLQDLSELISHRTEPKFSNISHSLSHYFGLVQSSQSAGEAFWKLKADGFVSHKFPVMTPLHDNSSNTLSVSRTCEAPSSVLRQAASKASLTMQAALQAAWARLLGAYLGESRVTFGVVLDGRTTDVAQNTTLPMIITLPVIVDNAASNSELAHQMMEYNSELRRFQFMPMAQIQRSLGTADTMFDTILIYQAADKTVKPPPFRVIKELASVEYPISLEVEESSSDTTQLNLVFKASILPQEQATLLLAQFEAVLIDLLYSAQGVASHLAIGRSDLFSILPPTCESLPIDGHLLHELLEQSAQLMPFAIALEFIDDVTHFNNARRWTYQELDILGNQVAHFITLNGISPGSIIATCFNKCPTAYFVLLGILKAGCAFLCLDPSAPATRQNFILDDSNAAMLMLEERFSWAHEASLPVHMVTEVLVLQGLSAPMSVQAYARAFFITGGEKLRSDILEAWGSTRVIHNAYGPTEATIGITMYRGVPENGRPSNIGNLFPNVGAYIFEPNSEIPVLRGGVGELCVSGKLVGKGYLNREALTKERFPVLQASGERVYRTGDLVRVLPDDSIDFLGRADDQVKLRGQRLEIGEINHVIREGLADKVGDIATIVTRRKAQDIDLLVSFVSLSSNSGPARELRIYYDASHIQFAGLAQEACRSRLATYMVPSFIICVSRIPLSTNNKVDINQLKKLFSELSNEKLQALSAPSLPSRRELNNIEKEVLKAINQVVDVQENDINPTTTIFQLGIDSITATRLARQLRTMGHTSATPSMILRHPQISQLSEALGRPNIGVPSGNALQVNQSIKALRQRYLGLVCRALEVNTAEVKYIAPCTPLQQGIIARSKVREAQLTYFNQFQIRLDSGVSVDHLKASLSRVISAYSILRTAFVDTPEGFVQVAIKNWPLRWFEVEANMEVFEQTITERRHRWIEANHDVLKWPVEVDHMDIDGQHYLLLRLFHGVYDARSLSIILQSLESEYHGIAWSSGPAFVSVLPEGPLLNHQESHQFWKSLLENHRFQPIPSLIDRPAASSSLVQHSMNLEGLEYTRKRLQVTHQTLLQAAWLHTLRRYFVDPPTIGVILSGRSLAINDIDLVVGPLFNTLPLRVDITDDMSWVSLARKIQEHNNSLLTFVHTPLRDIQKLCSNGQPLFDTLFTFDHDYKIGSQNEQTLWSIHDSPAHPDYPLAIEVIMIADDTLRVTLAAQGGIADEATLDSLLAQFVESLHLIITSTNGDPLSLATHPEINKDVSISVPEPISSTGNYATTPEDAFVWDEESYNVRRELAILTSVDEQEISEKTNIFALGLDSIDVIKLAGRLTRLGYRVSVGTLMKQPTLESIIASLEKSLPSTTNISSTTEADSIISILKDCYHQTGLDFPDVEAILPPTPLQDSMVAEMLHSDFHTYFNHDVLELSPDTNIDHLKSALSTVYANSPILRTVFVEVDDPRINSAYCQVVRKHELEFAPTLKITNMDDISMLTNTARLRALGSNGTSDLFQVHFVELEKKNLIVLSIAHALYDGWSLDMLHKDIQTAYENNYMPRQSYKSYLSHMILRSNSLSQQFWADLLHGADATLVPKSNTASGHDTVHRLERQSKMSISNIKALCKDLRVTPQVLGQACWAAVLASLTKSLDVVFGVVLSGRDTDEAQELMFPTMNTVPLRLTLHGTIIEFLGYCQDIMSTVVEFQHTPLRDIQKLSPNRGDKLFNTIFLLQNSRGNDTNSSSFLKSTHSVSAVDYPLCAELEITGNDAVWRIACEKNYMSLQNVERLGASLERALDYFAQDFNEQVLKISSHGPQTVSICGLKPVALQTDSQRQESDSVKNGDAPQQIVSPPQGYETLLEVLSDLSNVDQHVIDLNLSIFHIGLDSISAIKASSMLRKRGLEISTRDLVTIPSIRGILEQANRATTEKPQSSRGNLMGLNSIIGRKEIRTLIQQAGLLADSVETILPALPMQVHTLSVWQNSGGATFSPKFSFKVSGPINLTTVSRAWVTLVSEIAMLRTHLVNTASTSLPFVQVILESKFASQHATSITTESNGQWEFVYAATPFAVVQFLVAKPGEVNLILYLHHALYDGVSLPIILDRFATLVELCSFNPLISERSPWYDFTLKHLDSTTQARRKSFWTSYLKGNTAVQLYETQQTPTVTQGHRVKEFRRTTINNFAALRLNGSKQGISTQALLFAAYSKALAKRLRQDRDIDGNVDCIFGIYLANRSGYAAIEDVPFPTLNILPLRVKDPLSRSTTTIAADIQKDVTEISRFENSTAGLWEIHKWTGVRIDTFVNILSFPDGPSPPGRNSITLKEVPNNELSPLGSADISTHLIAPDDKSLSPNAVTHSYPEGVDIELALREDVLDLGIFGPSNALSATQANDMVTTILSEIKAL